METIMQPQPQALNQTPAYALVFGERDARQATINDRPAFMPPEEAMLKDIRRKDRVRVAVVNRNTMNLGLPGGRCTVGIGRTELELYRDELPALMAMVEPEPQLIEEARREFLRAVVRYMLEEPARCNLGAAHHQKLEAMEVGARLELIYSRTDPKITESFDLALRLTGKSPEGEFRAKNDRDVRPLVSVEVLEELGMPEQLPETVQAAAAASANAPLVEVLKKQLEQNAALIAALMADKKGGK